MPKGKKKRKQRREMPPLSRLDRLIYGVSGTVMFAIIAVYVLWFCSYPPMEHWFDSETVFLCRVHASRLWALPFLVSLSVTFLALWSSWYGARRPIFGIKGFLYGPPLPNYYPVFMKNKPSKKPRDRKFTRWLTGLVLGINLAMLAMVPLSLNGRDEWHLDGTVRDVNMFGRTAAEYDVYDSEKVILGSVGHSRGRGWRRSTWLELEITVVMDDGESFTFEIRNSSLIPEVEAVLGNYHTVAADPATDLEALIDDMHPTAEEEAILRRLFQIEN